MAITYPRLLPDNGRLQEGWFELQDNVAVSPSGLNKINLSQVNPPAWQGHFVTGILGRDQEPIWNAWRNTLRGGLKQFIASDVRRRTPLAYPDAHFASDIKPGWNGTVGVSSLGLSGALGLSGLPDGYQFKVGDRIGLEQSGRYGYYEVAEDVTATGTTAAITVTPFLHTTIFTTSAVCRLWRPLCQFILDNTSWSQTGMTEDSAISFKGIQRL